VFIHYSIRFLGRGTSEEQSEQDAYSQMNAWKNRYGYRIYLRVTTTYTGQRECETTLVVLYR
jgi:hypothetical protein